MTAILRDLDLRAARAPRAFPDGLPPTGFFKRPRLPQGVHFALCMDRLLRPEERNPFAVKPWAFATLPDLARSIHRRRAGRGLQLLDAPLLVEPRRCPDAPTHGVTVWALDVDGHARAFLGWAYLMGGGQQDLAYALQRFTLAYGG